MKYFKVTVKFGHVGKNNYYKGYLFINAESGKDAARIARYFPRVKHDHKDAILQVEKIDFQTFKSESKKNCALNYFKCYNVQKQREYFFEIEDSVYRENAVEQEYVRHSKKRSLRKIYNDDPDFDYYKNKINIDYFVA